MRWFIGGLFMAVGVGLGFCSTVALPHPVWMVVLWILAWVSLWVGIYCWLDR